MKNKFKLALLYLFILLSMALLIHHFLPSIQVQMQNGEYFQFIDQRSWGPIPNALNVASNCFFFLVGMWGLMKVARAQFPERSLWVIFFAGVTLTAFGSSYFHLMPNWQSLFFDRLPMAFSFVSLSWIFIQQDWHFHKNKLGIILTLLLAPAAVLCSHFNIDERPYVMIQFLPMGLVLLRLFGKTQAPSKYDALVFILYALAKLTELLDGQIYQATQSVLSGHTLKHLLAALACGILVPLALKSAKRWERSFEYL